MSEYILGTNEAEHARLRHQHEVWGPVTRAFLEREGVGPGMRVLDAGCGPGFVTGELRERVGEAGRVTAVDESPVWAQQLQQLVRDEGWQNVEFQLNKLEQAVLAPASFDLVFSRWVFSFISNPLSVLIRLREALVGGGRLLVQDYNHEGVSLFPASAGFDAVIRATREFYAAAGGDTWIAGRLPALIGQAGLRVSSIHSSVLSGGPDSAAFRWADSFFPTFADQYLERGFMTEEEWALFRRDWAARKADPGAVFFSPIVVDLAAVAP